MSPTWDSSTPPEREAIAPMGWLRALLRGAALGGLVFGALLLLLLVRLVERPLYGLRRPLSPYITQFVCRNALRILGLRFDACGQLMAGRGAVVANHSSWLDIFALNARQPIYFVSKAEVAKWPGIGWLARATGTVFIERNPRRAREQTQVFEQRLMAGHRLVFFPEGTSSDGLRVLPFKSTLFAAFLTQSLREILFIQPVTVVYHPPAGKAPRFYGFWGGMYMGPHLLKVLASDRQGRVQVIYHPPVRVADFDSRKALAAHVEAVVRQGFDRARTSG